MARPKTGETPTHKVHMALDLWKLFGTAVGITRRSRTIREFVEWFVGMPGAKLPLPERYAGLADAPPGHCCCAAHSERSEENSGKTPSV